MSIPLTSDSSETGSARMIRRTVTTVTDLLRTPEGARDRQLLFGDTVTVHAAKGGWCHVEAEKDGYTGYVPAVSLGPDRKATHWVIAQSSHIYEAPEIKAPDYMALSFGSRVTLLSEQNGFGETPDGFVPMVHLTPQSTRLDDPLNVAVLFLGTPYLWGGNSRFGIDCSGLVQAAFLACGRGCPADSGQQETAFGPALSPGTAPRRGDLLFWKGHVAMVSDPDTLLHANSHHMAVRYEPLQSALTRIAEQGGGQVTSHRRP